MEWDKSLLEVDPEIYDIIEHEKSRQWGGIELIASENFTSSAVMECLGSCLTNKYSEGLPGKRYYGGNEFIDQMEILCQRRALAAFSLSPEEWGVNVQAYSGSPANLAVYTALLSPHDRIMGLALPSGGHLTHGYYTAKKKISASSIFFESLPYGLNAETGLIDYESLDATAKVFLPKLLICGASAYSRDYDYAQLRATADAVGAYLMADIAHYSGLVASGLLKSPFDFCDVVTTTTHKTMRGPRGAIIFYKKSLEERINFAVFPSLQGGPHNNNIAGIAVQLKQLASEEYKAYARTVIANTQAMAAHLTAKGYKIISGGSDNHLILWDLRPQDLTGSKYEKVCELANITVNKNSVPGDTSALIPGGVRIGTPAMTTRGADPAQFEQIAEFLHRAVQIALSVQAQHGKKLQDFASGLQGNEEIAELKREVFSFSSQFPMPGFNNEAMRYRSLENN